MKQKQFLKAKTFRFKRFSHKAYSAFNSMHKVVSIGVVTGSVLTFAQVGEVSAQTSADSIRSEKASEKELDEVMVTASRVTLSQSQASRLVTVITQADITQAPALSIQDLLGYLANVDVIQRGGQGVQADISIRGGSFDQTAILLNGVNLSNPQTGHYSFDIPVNLSDIERIEIIHGPSSLTYGASAFSGGINIITKKNPDHKAYGRLEVGGHKLVNVETGGVYKKSNILSQLSAGYRTSDGYIKNSDYKILNLLWQTRFDVEQSKIDVQLGYNDKKYGANTFYSEDYPNQYDATSSYFMSIKSESGDKFKVIPQIYWNRHDDCFQLFRDGTPNLPAWYKGHNYHQSQVFGANLNMHYQSKLGITSFGSEFRNEGILSNVLGELMKETEGRYTKSADHTNVSYTLEHNILLNKLTFSVGVLANYNTVFQKSFKFFPSINSSYRILDELKIYASWNKAMRMPTFTDLYYSTATHIGNTDLKPETSEAFELGFKYHNHFMDSYITGYLMDGRNMIDWVKPAVGEKWEAQNIPEINKKGIELNTKFYIHELIPNLTHKIILQVGYTRLHQDKNAGDLISNNTLTYLRDKFTTQLNHPIYKNVSVNWNFRWQKRVGNYIANDEVLPYPQYSILDMRVNWKLNDFMLNLNINNIYNTHYFDLGSIPQAEFWLIGGVSYTLR